jgi:hypothetical protein
MNKKKLTTNNNLFGGTSTSTEKNFVSSSTGTNNFEGGTQTEHSGFLPKPPKPPGNLANPANNLMKALKDQNEASSQGHTEVDVFLESAGLPRYRDTFLDNGVEDLETILELDDKHLEQMGVPMGHKLKLVKRIKEIRVSKGLHVPPSRQGGEREKPAPTAAKVEPNANSGGVGTENQEKKQSSEGGVGGENTLLDGFYDEEEQARQF